MGIWTMNKFEGGYQIGTAEHGVIVSIPRRDGRAERGDRPVIIPEDVERISQVVCAVPETLESIQTVLGGIDREELYRKFPCEMRNLEYVLDIKNRIRYGALHSLREMAKLRQAIGSVPVREKKAAENIADEAIHTLGALEGFVSSLAESGRIVWKDDAPIFWSIIEEARTIIRNAQDGVRPSEMSRLVKTCEKALNLFYKLGLDDPEGEISEVMDELQAVIAIAEKGR